MFLSRQSRVVFLTSNPGYCHQVDNVGSPPEKYWMYRLGDVFIFLSVASSTARLHLSKNMKIALTAKPSSSTNAVDTFYRNAASIGAPTTEVNSIASKVITSTELIQKIMVSLMSQMFSTNHRIVWKRKYRATGQSRRMVPTKKRTISEMMYNSQIYTQRVK